MKFSVPNMRLSLLSIAATGGMIAALVGNSAQAALTWYDGFSLADDGGDYALTTFVDPDVVDPLAGQSGGAGSFMTGGPWVQAGGDTAWVQANSLERTFQDNTPAQIVAVDWRLVGDDPAARTGCCHTARNGMAMATPWGGFDDPDGEFYMSFLANFGDGPHAEPPRDRMVGRRSRRRNIVLEFGIGEFSGVGGGKLRSSR